MVKNCSSCNIRISDNYVYCPTCGRTLNQSFQENISILNIDSNSTKKYSSILNPEENAIRSYFTYYEGRYVTFLLTDRRILIITERGFFTKEYDIDLSIPFENINHVKYEGNFWLKNLEFTYLDNEKSKPLQIRGIKDGGKWSDYIQTKIDEIRESKDRKRKAIMTINAQEKTTFQEIIEIDPSFTDEDEMIHFLQININQGNITGFIDKQRKQFTHMTAYKQKTEVVQYNIAANFSFVNGMLEINCPYCGASNPQKEKINRVTCQYCSKNYIIPDKILKLL